LLRHGTSNGTGWLQNWPHLSIIKFSYLVLKRSQVIPFSVFELIYFISLFIGCLFLNFCWWMRQFFWWSHPLMKKTRRRLGTV
jgi:hypothetical protein